MKAKRTLLYCFLIFMSCDPGGPIPLEALNGNILRFYCGQVKLSASTTGGFIFTIEQKFSTNDTVIIYPDSLSILYMNKKIPFKLWDEENVITEKKLIILKEKTLYADIKIDGGTAKGDTLLVLTKGYIYCTNRPITNDTIRIRIDKGF